MALVALVGMLGLGTIARADVRRGKTVVEPGATDVLMIYAVKQGLEFFNIGFASAIANLMILCIAIFSAAFILLVRRADRRANEL